MFSGINVEKIGTLSHVLWYWHASFCWTVHRDASSEVIVVLDVDLEAYPTPKQNTWICIRWFYFLLSTMVTDHEKLPFGE